MEKFFKFKENGTSLKTEIIAGITTFMTMAYIIALNPNLLTGFDVGSPLWNGVFLATCIASAIGTFCMGLLANKPFAMAPGMGLNSFFAIVVTNIVTMTGMSYLDSFQSALIIILIEGVVFILLSMLNIRDKIVEAIPLGVRLGIGPSIGFMIMNIGFGSNAGVYAADGNAYYVMRDFFGALTADYIRDKMGDAFPTMLLTATTMLVGFFLIIFLEHKKVNGAVLYGIFGASVFYWAGEAIFLHTNPFASLKGASFVPPFKDMMATTFCKFNIEGFLEIGWVAAITLVVTFCIIDMFDTIGTLVGTASRAGMLNEKGEMPKMKEALLSDAIGTVVGSVTGTSTITTFVESAAGVSAGGRTGLTAIVTGIIFLLCIFLAPIAALIPAAATSAALIYVGCIMLGNLRNIDWNDKYQFYPVCVMLLAMPISGSIGHGIGLALITYTVMSLISGKAKNVSVLTYVLSAIFIVKFFIPM